MLRDNSLIISRAYNMSSKYCWLLFKCCARDTCNTSPWSPNCHSLQLCQGLSQVEDRAAMRWAPCLGSRPPSGDTTGCVSHNQGLQPDIKCSCLITCLKTLLFWYWLFKSELRMSTIHWELQKHRLKCPPVYSSENLRIRNCYSHSKYN